MNDSRSAFACPQCHTWLMNPARRCAWCELDLSWIYRDLEFCRALRQAACGELVAEISLASLDEECQHLIPFSEESRRVDWRFGGEAWSCEFEEKNLFVVRRERRHAFTWPLKAGSVEGRLLSVRLRSKRQGHPAPALETPQIDTRPLREGGNWIGRQRKSGGRRVVIESNDVEMEHAFLYASEEERWLVACAGPTFVNGRCVLSTRLKPNDFLQFGPFGFRFTSEEKSLTAVGPIRSAAMGGALRPGKIIAIIGSSGAGKSTLIRRWARGLARSSPTNVKWGYVTQEDTLHRDLPLRQALHYSARLRQGENSLNEHPIRDLCRRLGVDWDEKATQLVGTLSGGELKRIRVVTEVAAEPAILLLDEPTSGLDPENANAVLNLLRELALRGAAIGLVTHQAADVEKCDYVLPLGKEEIDLVAVDEYLRGNPELTFPDPRIAKAAVAPARSSWARLSFTANRSKLSWKAKAAGAARMISILLAREFQRLRSAWLSRLVLPLALMPMLFAATLTVAVPSENSAMLGFLLVISTIWMAGSLTLTQIVDEQEIVDYERLVFLKTPCYLAAKLLVGGALGAIQAVVFAVTTVTLRFAAWDDRPSATLYLWRSTEAGFPIDVWRLMQIALVLIAISVAAACLGLTLSAMAYVLKRKEFALITFPLVMMVNMALSAQVHTGGCQWNVYNEEFQWVGGDFAAKGSYLTLSRAGDHLLSGFVYERLPRGLATNELGWLLFWIVLFIVSMTAMLRGTEFLRACRYRALALLGSRSNSNPNASDSTL